MSKILERANDPFEIGLQSWVDGAPEGEKNSRIMAMFMMIVTRDNPQIDYLDLDGLGLSSLPSQIGDLVNLGTLKLENNQLTTLPPETRNLTSLTYLNLDNNQLTTLPSEIGNFTALTHLNLRNNQLITLPSGIWNLTALTELNLSGNQLTNLSPEIGNLTALRRLYLGRNQLTTVPSEIGNLTALWLNYLNLSDNQLTTIPYSLLAARPAGAPRFYRGNDINLEYNLIPPSEVQILNNLALRNGVNLEISIHDHTQLTTPQAEALTAMVIEKILATSSNKKEFGAFFGFPGLEYFKIFLGTSSTEEAKKELQTFFGSPGLENFKMFLGKCPRTEGWKSQEAEMIGCLLEIANKMSQSEAVKIKCKTLAETAVGSCGDRVSLAFVQMQLALNLSDKKVEEMSIQEVYDYAKQESVIKFLSEKAKAKIAKIKTTGGALDEIETHLAYLQIGQELGLNLKANGMLYKRCSNVEDRDLESAKQEFLKLNREHQIAAKHIYEDEMLSKHAFVNEIIEKVAARNEFDLDLSPEKGEDENDFNIRMNASQEAFSTAMISEIQKAIQGELTNSSADSTEKAASQQAPDTRVTLLAASRTDARDPRHKPGYCTVM